MTKTPFEIQNWTLMSAACLICGIVGLYITITHPIDGIASYLWLAFIVLGAVYLLQVIQYYYDMKKDPENPKKIYLTERDERDILVHYKTGWATFIMSLIIVVFFAFFGGYLLEILSGTTLEPEVMSAARTIGMLLFFLLAFTRACAHSYFDKKT